MRITYQAGSQSLKLGGSILLGIRIFRIGIVFQTFNHFSGQRFLFRSANNLCLLCCVLTTTHQLFTRMTACAAGFPLSASSNYARYRAGLFRNIFYYCLVPLYDILFSSGSVLKEILLLARMRLACDVTWRKTRL